MAGRATYTDHDRARVYIVLTANQGNIKRTSRDTGVPESTIRTFRDEWASNGPPAVDDLPVAQAMGDFIADAERVRNKALIEMERKIPDATPSALVAIVGMLTEKIALVKGLATSRTEHVHTLPPPDEIREALKGFMQGALEAAHRRSEEIVEAEFTEQADLALPTPKP